VGTGCRNAGSIPPPDGLASGVLDIAAYSRLSCYAVKDNGSVVQWVPGGSLVAVPSTIKGVVQAQNGISHCLALTREGTVLAWGDNGYGQTTVPADLGKRTAVARAATVARPAKRMERGERGDTRLVASSRRSTPSSKRSTSVFTWTMFRAPDAWSGLSRAIRGDRLVPGSQWVRCECHGINHCQADIPVCPKHR